LPTELLSALSEGTKSIRHLSPAWVALLHAIFYFVNVVIGAKAKLNLIFKRVCEKAKRLYEVASSYQYAVADGIHRILFASRTGPRMPPPKVCTDQLVLSFLAPPP